MAGSIEVKRDVRWSAASWLFDWVVRTLAEAVRPSDTAAVLDEIVDENLGWLGLADLSVPDGALLREVICRSLLDSAEKELPADLAGRDGVLSGLRELVELSCGRPEPPEPAHYASS
jgi:hypothetical protein